MAITTEYQRAPELPSPTPSDAPRRARAALTWAAGFAALVATAVLVIAVVTNDDTPPARNLHFDVGDAKDRPQYKGYGPPIRETAERADATTDGNLHFDVGDAKDHPRYHP
jgi:hypothetical protein